jgi:hypothetical protein
MKKYLILITVVTISLNSFAASINGKHFFQFNCVIDSPASQKDTAKYIYEHVVLQKTKYQHKDLNEMLKTLNIEVKSYLPIHGRIVGYRKGIILFFENNIDISGKLEKRVHTNSIYVEFEKPIPLSLINPTLNKSHGAWLASEKEFYGKQIIGDIQGTKP